MHESIDIWVDGSTYGNPGPSGIGILMKYKGSIKEIKEYIGVATIHTTELKAIERSLDLVKDKSIPINIFSDSKYAVYVLTERWTAHNNTYLIDNLKNKMHGFNNISFIKVLAHSGITENERVDQLAKEAVREQLVKEGKRDWLEPLMK